uniref:protein SPO16 homolog n=1 Tax=Panthera onca TaxID=9690 RepID=UPI0029535DB0|nr:protein SPO16 homolog [Panthera onca]
MAENGTKEKIKWTTTIIISSSLKDYSYRPDTFSKILGVAFLLMDAKECFTSAEEIFLAKIEKFTNIHQNSFLVLSAAFHGPEEWKLMFRIQQRFLGSNLRILPVHNTVDVINLMCTIAKMASKPYIDNICYRMVTTEAYIIEQSPVWKTLQKLKLSSDSFNPN